MSASRSIAILVVGLALPSGAVLGCALTEKAEVLDVHYYSAEAAPAPPKAAPPAVPGADGEAAAPPPLRLGRVSAGAHLGKKVVYRSSSVELGMYDDKRWTERPDEYLRRAVSAALFDSQRATQSLSGAGPTLDLELLAFEEIVENEKPSKGRVSLRFALHDELRVIVSDVVTVEIDARSTETSQVVRAISRALDEATNRVAERVAVRLADATKTAER